MLAGLVANHRAWLNRITPAVAAQFDYIIGEVAPATTSDQLTEEAVRIIETEPVDILGELNELPAGQSLTEAQMQRIIAAAVKHGVAFEIGTNRPGVTAGFIRLAKAAGAKFTIGSHQATAATWGDWSHALGMQREAGITWRDMYMPGHEPTRAQRALAK